jgi:hypothetical protein
MWGINLQLGGGRLGFVFNGLSGASGERGLTGQESFGGVSVRCFPKSSARQRRTKPGSPSKGGIEGSWSPLESRPKGGEDRKC